MQLSVRCLLAAQAGILRRGGLGQLPADDHCRELTPLLPGTYLPCPAAQVISRPWSCTL